MCPCPLCFMPLSLMLPSSVQVRARERHVRLPWPALRHHLDLIAYVGGDPERYREAYHSGAMYISDTMERLHVRLKFPEGVGWD